jgi:phage tail-like protein
MADRKDPYRNFRFKLEIDGIIQAGFSEASIPDASSDVTEYREGNETPTARKLPGLNKYGNVTLKWGVTDSVELYEKWRKLVEDGLVKANRKNIAIVILAEDGSDGARWEFTNAWPNKYKAPDLTAKGNDVAIESIEISHEGMRRVK